MTNVKSKVAQTADDMDYQKVKNDFEENAHFVMLPKPRFVVEGYELTEKELILTFKSMTYAVDGKEHCFISRWAADADKRTLKLANSNPSSSLDDVLLRHLAQSHNREH